MTSDAHSAGPWYREVTRYQWLVLLIASLGWIFDIFEGQIFVTSMNEAMPSLLEHSADQGTVSFYNNLALGAFLVGGAFGGVLFGMVSDRIGRTRTMIVTILMYSLFTCLTAFCQAPWQMVVLRFLVAMGIGGEWAVASAMIAEVFPHVARARSLGVFHATSVFGSYLAIAAGAFIVGNKHLQTEAYPDLNWRLGFLVGVLPALLTIWIRLRLREPERWVQARTAAREGLAQRTGRISELFSGPLLRNALVGVSLATIGLATFWGVRIYGKDLMRATLERPYAAMLPVSLRNGDKPAEAVLNGDLDAMLRLFPEDLSEAEKWRRLEAVGDRLGGTTARSAQSAGTSARRDRLTEAFRAKFETIKRREMLGHFLVITGGLPGLLAFAPLSERVGRRLAFLLFHLGGFLVSVFLFGVVQNPDVQLLWVALPVFGCFTVGMHAGYAVYFPELFPTRLRGTGGGFCFNVGRLVAAPTLILSGWMQRGSAEGGLGFSLEEAATLLSFLFLLGGVVLLFAPETKGRDLPE